MNLKKREKEREERRKRELALRREELERARRALEEMRRVCHAVWSEDAWLRLVEACEILTTSSAHGGKKTGSTGVPPVVAGVPPGTPSCADALRNTPRKPAMGGTPEPCCATPEPPRKSETQPPLFCAEFYLIMFDRALVRAVSIARNGKARRWRS